jgi:hypothetical protein
MECQEIKTHDITRSQISEINKEDNNIEETNNKELYSLQDSDNYSQNITDVTNK